MPSARLQSSLNGCETSFLRTYRTCSARNPILWVLALVIAPTVVLAQSENLPPEARIPLERLEPVIEFPVANSEHTPVRPDELEGKDKRRWREARSDAANGLWTAAQDKLDTLIDAQPGFIDARLLRANVHARLGDNGAAQRDLLAVIKIDPRNVTAHGLTGELALIDGAAQAAVLSLRLAYAAHPDEPHQPERVVAALLLARTLESEGYLTAALELYAFFQSATNTPSTAMRRHERLREMMSANRSELDRRIAELQMRLGQFDAAIESWKTVTASDSNDINAWRQLAWSQAATGAIDAAFESLTRVFRAAPAGIDIQTEVIQLCARLPDSKDCTDRARALLVEYGDAPSLLTSARQALAEDNAELADIMIDAARGKAPDNIDVRVAVIRQQLRKAHWVAAANELTTCMAASHDPIGVFDASFERAAPDVLGAIGQALSDNEYRSNAPDLKPYITALLLSSKHDHAEAVNTIAPILSNKPTDQLARAILARAQIAMLDWDAALATCKELDETAAHAARLTLARGRINFAFGYHSAARGNFRKALQLDPNLSDAAFALAELEGRAQSINQRNDAMIAVLIELLNEIDPRHALAREILVDYFLRLGETDTARRTLDGYRKFGAYGPAMERAQALYQLATDPVVNRTIATNQYQSTLKQIIEKYPTDPYSHLVLANHYAALGLEHMDAALEHLHSALALDKNLVAALDLAANLNERLLRFRDSETQYRQILAHFPNSGAYQEKLRLLLRDRGDFDGAADLLEAQIANSESDDQKNRYTEELIAMLKAGERFDRAITSAKAWLDQKPDDLRRRSIYVDVLSTADRHDEAIARARDYFMDESDDDTKNRLRFALQRAGRETEAQQLLLRWLEDEPTTAWINTGLIEVCWSAGKWQEAIEIARAAYEAEPERGYQEYLITAYRFANEPDESVRMRRQAVSEVEARLRNIGNNRWMNDTLRNQMTGAQINLVDELMAVERYSEAARMLQSMIQSESQGSPGETVNEGLILALRNTLSEVYRLDGDIGKSIAELELIYQTSPTDPGAANNLGYTLIDNDREAARAEELVRFSLSSDPNTAATLDSMGWIFYKKGEYEQALDLLTRARYRSDRLDPVVFDHLGDASYRAGKTEDARAYWQRAADLCKADAYPPPGAPNRQMYPALQAKLNALATGKEPNTAMVLSPKLK